MGCHGFESRMAAVQRDEDGWRDRVNYMRNTMFVRATDEQADNIVSYLTAMFGPDSTALCQNLPPICLPTRVTSFISLMRP